MASHKILIVGFGNIGQGFFELLNSKRNQLGLIDTVVSEIVDIKYGYVKNPAADIVSQIQGGKTFEKRDPLETIRESKADIVCEFTWVNIKDGEPGFSHIREALRDGKHAITTNKGPIALHYEELQDIARRSRKKLRFKGTVMSGTPSFNLLELLPGIDVQRIRGIFNGTTNFILTEMMNGKTFNDSLRLAQSKGYAEADPSNDIDGYDAALKAVIFSKVVGWSKNNFKDVEIKGIRDISLTPGPGKTKLLVNIDKDSVSVKPVRLPPEDGLANIDGVLNAVELSTDTLGKVLVVGPGAGRTETAQAVMTDLVEVLK
jgi:homoserine dehydrogenase